MLLLQQRGASSSALQRQRQQQQQQRRGRCDAPSSSATYGRCFRPAVLPTRPTRAIVCAVERDGEEDPMRLAGQGSIDYTMDSLKTIVQPGGVEALRPAAMRVEKEKTFTDANFPIDAEGRSLHLGTRRGEVANRVLSVGSMDRALLIAGMLEPPRPGAALFQHLSGRGFLTVTGRYQGVPVSVVTTLMGMANMDFVVRECAAAVDGQMAVVRLGTCGALRPPARLGDMLVARDGAVCVRRDPDAWTLADGRPRYPMTHPVAPDPELTALLERACAQEVGGPHVVSGLNATADSFYGTQGRTGGPFDDDNAGLIQEMLLARPELISLEMETFQLLHLAACSGGRVRGAAFCVALAERYSNRFLDAPTMRRRELQGGRAALAALVGARLEEDASLGAAGARPRPAGGYVWEESYVERAAGGGGGGNSKGGGGNGGGGGGGQDAGERLLGAELARVQQRIASERGGGGSGGEPS